MSNNSRIPACVRKFHSDSQGYLATQKEIQKIIENALTPEEEKERLERMVFNSLGVLDSSKPVDRASARLGLREYMENPHYMVALNPNSCARVLKVVQDSGSRDNGFWDNSYYHEKEHWDKAKELGFPEPFFIFYFVKTRRKGVYGFGGGVSPGKIPDTMSDGDYTRNFRKIIEAPDTLSVTDRGALRL